MKVRFEEWYALFTKYKNSEFKTKEDRRSFERDFTELSKVYWNSILDSADTSDDDHAKIVESLAEIWCSTDKSVINSDNMMTDAQESYLSALERLEYSSDRMNFNRWLHIRLLLNSDIK